ncbi:hypothetical protein BZK31_15030 [Pseudomonas floridensis]|uniref:Uncharacterized protein n=1 Tax=Pseudomonas floridensis TaxID=1958950 RepID=A0A1X0N4N2_9PSED|nr:hypothetical protein BZK31_15030 [Pseudomonas floridensis]
MLGLGNGVGWKEVRRRVAGYRFQVPGALLGLGRLGAFEWVGAAVGQLESFGDDIKPSRRAYKVGCDSLSLHEALRKL